GPDLYAKTLDIVAKDTTADGLLVIVTPQAMSDPTQTAEQLRLHTPIEGKPVLASWMGGPDIAAGEAILNRANIPTFNFPDTAARVFNYMHAYNENLRAIYETPMVPPDSDLETPDRAAVDAIFKRALAGNRTILTEYESKRILGAYYIPTVPTEVAADEDSAVTVAERFGYPVVIKLNSETITHKTDVGGVQLNLRDADAVRHAFQTIKQTVTERAGAEHFQGVAVQPMAKLDGYELIIGSSIDPQFGPVLLFGAGGTMVEVFKDRSLGLPPLNTTLARRMMEETKIYEALKGVRGRKSVDMSALERLMVRFSQLVVEQPWIKEIDINPLLISEERMIALDARVVLHDASTPEDQLPRPAIRPYPIQYVNTWTSKDGTRVNFRPIRPEDEPLLVRFHELLSERTVFLRYLQTMQLSQRIGHERLSRLSFIDYAREIALVAVHYKQESGQPEIMAVGRVSKVKGTNNAEFNILVADQFQHQGLGREMMRRLIEVARAEQIEFLFWRCARRKISR
ncbi:MAG: GNAT family N-acetyltransferase, partial [Blastochloris sp.]|nr:GNAT family N-acetyltransferase [Blastochloris sp.]